MEPQPQLGPSAQLKRRLISLAYLTSHRCTPAQAVQVAAESGYDAVGLRLWPNAPGAPQQRLLGEPALLRETLAAQRDTGVAVLDLEIIRLDADFDVHTWDALYEAAAALQARAILVAGDDPEPARLAQNYGELCAVLQPLGLSADLEFMPWTAVPNARHALKIVQEAGSPTNAGILIDALHVDRSDTTMDDLLALPRQLLHYAQLCDAPCGLGLSTAQMIHAARCERLLPGEGEIDLDALMAVLPADLPISIEVVHFERERHTTPRAWASSCLAASRRWL